MRENMRTFEPVMRTQDTNDKGWSGMSKAYQTSGQSIFESEGAAIIKFLGFPFAAGGGICLARYLAS